MPPGTPTQAASIGKHRNNVSLATEHWRHAVTDLLLVIHTASAIQQSSMMKSEFQVKVQIQVQIASIAPQPCILPAAVAYTAARNAG